MFNYLSDQELIQTLHYKRQCSPVIEELCKRLDNIDSNIYKLKEANEKIESLEEKIEDLEEEKKENNKIYISKCPICLSELNK